MKRSLRSIKSSAGLVYDRLFRIIQACYPGSERKYMKWTGDRFSRVNTDKGCRKSVAVVELENSFIRSFPTAHKGDETVSE